MDIINLIQNIKNVSVGQAIAFICDVLNISTSVSLKVGFDNSYENPDLKILERMDLKKPVVDMSRDFKILDENVLAGFYRLYHPSFYNDGISIETLFKFGILYDIYLSLSRKIYFIFQILGSCQFIGSSPTDSKNLFTLEKGRLPKKPL